MHVQTAYHAAKKSNMVGKHEFQFTQTDFKIHVSLLCVTLPNMTLLFLTNCNPSLQVDPYYDHKRFKS